jgi:hypothetical protein
MLRHQNTVGYVFIPSYIATVFINDVGLALRGVTCFFQDFHYMYCRYARGEPGNFCNLLCLGGPFVLMFIRLHTLMTAVYF